MTTKEQFAHMSDTDLQQMLASTLKFGPVNTDKEFVKDLTNEIARRKKEKGAQ